MDRGGSLGLETSGGAAPLYGGALHPPIPPPIPAADPNQFNDAWFYGPNGELSGNQFQWNLLGAGGRSGAFGPGDPRSVQRLRENFGHERDARVRNAMLQAQLFNPDDPLAASYARISGTQGAESDFARALSAAQLSSDTNKEDFYRRMVEAFLGGAINRRDPREPNPWAQAAGQGVGSAIGALGGRGAHP